MGGGAPGVCPGLQLLAVVVDAEQDSLWAKKVQQPRPCTNLIWLAHSQNGSKAPRPLSIQNHSITIHAFATRSAATTVFFFLSFGSMDLMI